MDYGLDPTLNGWVWDVPFWPNVHHQDGIDYYSIRSIFWYDSSNDLEFTKHPTGKYNIILPEFVIQSEDKKIKLVRDNVEKLWELKKPVVGITTSGVWQLHPHLYRYITLL